MRENKGLRCAALVASCLILSGCGGNAGTKEKASVKETAATVPEAIKAPEKAPCEAAIDEAVQKSRKTLRTVKATCQNSKIEANPMWSASFDGTVHLRVYDAGGKLIQDVMKKP